MPTCPPRCGGKYTCTDKRCIGIHDKFNIQVTGAGDSPEALKKCKIPCQPCKAYTWFSAPKSIYNTRKLVKIREPAPPQPFKNVMHDKRVLRGSNFSQTLCPDQQVYTKEQEAKRRLMLRKRCLARNQRNVIGSPPPIHGRVHIPIQTEKYLEELFDRPPEYDANTQTDLFLQRPPSPPYVPAKVGIDRATQIEDGDLFDFDAEAQPILDTLIGHSVQQSLIETLHEQEMAELKAKQEELLARREAELAELRRLEEEECRLQEEKERRIKQDEISKKLDTKLQEEVTAAKLLQGHIATILPDVLQKLEPQTDFAHKNELESKICPWLSKEVAEEVGKIIDSREILTEIIKEIIIQRASVYAGYSDGESEDDNNIIREEENDNYEDEDDEFIRDEINRMIENVDDRELGGQDINNKLETIEEEIIKEEYVPLQKDIKNLKTIDDCIEIAIKEESEEQKKIEKIVQEELMNIILTADLAQPFQEIEKDINDESSSTDIITTADKKIIDIDDDDDNSSDTEGIVRNEVDRILSLPADDSIEDTVDLITEIENIIDETETTTILQHDNDNTENDDIDSYDINADATDDDDDTKSDEQFLRNQIENMISDAEQTSTTDNNDISYIS